MPQPRSAAWCSSFWSHGGSVHGTTFSSQDKFRCVQAADAARSLRKLRLEHLEPRLVLSLLLGDDSGAASMDSIPLPSSLSLSDLTPSSAAQIPTAQSSTSQSSPARDQPRQLPGSLLRQYPPADLYKIEPVIVAGDPDGTPPDSPSNRVDPNTPDSDFAGVGSLRIKRGSSTSTCTATAISPTHVVTAAHCLDNNNDGVIDAVAADVTFNVNMSGSTTTYAITGSQLYVHPDWTGFNKPSINDDLGIVELSSEFPSDVPIYALNDVPFDDVVTAYFVGYGRSGNGIDGYTTSTSSTVKRWGMNDIDYFFTDDEGSGARETFQFDFDFPDAPDSLGNDRETTLGSGDSGGPSFIEDGNGGFKLFGINTYTTQFSPSSPTAPYFRIGWRWDGDCRLCGFH